MEKQFSYEMRSHEVYGEVIILRYEGDKGDKEVWIVPGYGFNLIKYSVNGENIIYTEQDEVVEQGFSGIPILYPTPNRVKDAVFQYDGQTYTLMKRGKKRVLHGLVYDEAWSFQTPEVSEDVVRAVGYVDFADGSENYESFPWRHKLSVAWKLYDDGIFLEYEVDNLSGKPLPFGFAIHTYFPVQAFGEEAEIKVPADYIYESTEDRYPTGRIIPVQGTKFDLNSPRKVGGLELDDVYTGLEKKTIEIAYGKEVFSLSASQEFGKAVVYTPNNTFYCIENQTCMTNAHNFYSMGYQDSGLVVVQPDGIHRGWIRLSGI